MFVSEIFTTAPTDERSAAEMATFALLDELGIPYEAVTKCGGDSYINIGRTKGAE